jgi:hypothetical protein
VPYIPDAVEARGGAAGEDVGVMRGGRGGVDDDVGVEFGDDRDEILLANRRNGDILPILPSAPVSLGGESDPAGVASSATGPATSLSISSTPFISASIRPIRSSKFLHLDFISANRRRTSPFLVLRSAIPLPRILRTRSQAGA